MGAMGISKRLVLVVFCGILALSAIGLLLLPGFIEKSLLPSTVARLGLGPARVTVRSLGLFHLDLAGVELGQEENPFLHIDSVRCDFSPASLLAGRIDSLTVGGLELRAAFRQGRLLLPGLDLDSVLGQAGGRATKGDKPAANLPLERLFLRNSSVTLEVEGKTLRLPLEFGVWTKAGSGRSRGEGRFFPGGQLLDLEAEYDSGSKRVFLRVQGEQLDLSSLAGLVAAEELGGVAGRMGLRAETNLELDPFRITGVEASAECRDFHYQRGALEFFGAEGLVAEELPLLRLSLQGVPASFTAELSGLGMGFAGGRGVVRRLAAECAFPEGQGTCRGELELAGRLAEVDDGFFLVLKNSFFLEKQNGGYHLEADGGIGSATGSGLTFTSGPHRISGKEKIGFRVEGLLDGHGKGALDWSVNWPGLAVRAAGTAVDAESLKGTGVLKLEATPEESGGWQSSFRWQLPKARIHRDGLVVSGEALQLEGSVRPGSGDPVSPFLVKAGLELKKGRVEDRDSGMTATGIELRLPLVYPPGSAEKGSVRVAGLGKGGRALGSLQSEVRQTTTGFMLRGGQQGGPLPGFGLRYEGRLDLIGGGPELELEVELPAFELGPALDVRTLATDLPEMRLSGKLAGQANFRYPLAFGQSSVEAQLQEGRLELPAEKIDIRGMTLELAFDDILRRPRSLPARSFAFAEASFGKVRLTDGRIVYQIESEDSLLVEKSEVRWAGGRIESGALRIRPGKRHYETTLYCDRLRLAALLEEFGGIKLEGGGTVSGIIPLVVEDGVPSFGEGFLYSTPGESGIIRVSSGETLLAGVPVGSLQFSQLDFALAALRNFRYNWAKLTFLTVGEELVLNMVLDGKPAEPLPFSYDRQSGAFRRLRGEGGIGINQPIVLEVNFRLPLGDILGYSSALGQLIDKMQ